MLDRPDPHPHLTFGTGRHLCFGDPLVRQTVRIALQSLYRRMPSLSVPEQELDRNNNLGFHGFTALRVTDHDPDRAAQRHRRHARQVQHEKR